MVWNIGGARVQVVHLYQVVKDSEEQLGGWQRKWGPRYKKCLKIHPLSGRCITLKVSSQVWGWAFWYPTSLNPHPHSHTRHHHNKPWDFHYLLKPGNQFFWAFLVHDWPPQFRSHVLRQIPGCIDMLSYVAIVVLVMCPFSKPRKLLMPNGAYFVKRIVLDISPCSGNRPQNQPIAQVPTMVFNSLARLTSSASKPGNKYTKQ